MMLKGQFSSTMIVLIMIIISVAIFVFLFFFALTLPQEIMTERDFRNRCENICASLNSEYVNNRTYAASYLRSNGWCDNRRISTGQNQSEVTDCGEFMGGCNVVSLGQEVLSGEC